MAIGFGTFLRKFFFALFFSHTEKCELNRYIKRKKIRWRLEKNFADISQNTIMINQQSDYIFSLWKWLFLGH